MILKHSQAEPVHQSRTASERGGQRLTTLAARAVEKLSARLCLSLETNFVLGAKENDARSFT
ncbi:MAG: hypothetical protein AAGK22_27895 [Acidobacteriota bacterium]